MTAKQGQREWVQIETEPNWRQKDSTLSPPQRLLLVNPSERKREKRERWREKTGAWGTMAAFPARFNFPSSQPPRDSTQRDCRRPLRRRERFNLQFLRSWEKKRVHLSVFTHTVQDVPDCFRLKVDFHCCANFTCVRA